MHRTFNTKIQHSYDKIAETWAKEREWYIEQPSIDETIAHLKPSAKILDVGCGSGKPIAAYLVEKGFDVYGLDISPNLLKHAAKIIPKEKLFEADLCEFTTKMHFDAIICWCTIFHVHAERHLTLLKKLHSFLVPAGVLCITFADTSLAIEDVPITIIDEYTIESEMFGERFCHSGRPASENSQLIKKAGFKIITDKIDQPGNQVILAEKL